MRDRGQLLERLERVVTAEKHTEVIKVVAEVLIDIRELLSDLNMALRDVVGELANEK